MTTLDSWIKKIVYSQVDITEEDKDRLLSIPFASLIRAAAIKRDLNFENVITYSKKVFVPLVRLCRDVCSYCSFSKVLPHERENPYLSLDEVLAITHQGANLGCHEALFTLGDKPEDRYPQARDHLHRLGFETTLDYLEYVAEKVLEQGKLLPHLNPGVMTAESLKKLRRVSASMGLMLETSSTRLTEKGKVHHGSPDKYPKVRLQTIESAGANRIPFSSGLLVGIGETRQERVETLLILRELHLRYGHIQEVIVQNFCPKPNIKMAHSPAASLEEHLWTIALARLIMPSDVSIQAPPNLSPRALGKIIEAGINDWGGVSPLTPDYVNPELPWPEIVALEKVTRESGKHLVQRLTAYPKYAARPDKWFDKSVQYYVKKYSDGQGLARDGLWFAGTSTASLAALANENCKVPFTGQAPTFISSLGRLLDKCLMGYRAQPKEIIRLFEARGPEFALICRLANELRESVVGPSISFVVNRNINYTNICEFRCSFCSFAKGGAGRALRETPYLKTIDEILGLAREAHSKGATEVCMQGGIHPSFTGRTYLDICGAVKSAIPQLHIHAFSPLEISQGAHSSGLSIQSFLQELKDRGLGTLPGTAAEILDDSVRRVICPDKLTSEQWLTIMRIAHLLGIKSTATIMFGHIEHYGHWASHLLKLRDLQEETQGFTEFVPLPFVHFNTPMYRKGVSRRGPTYREAILMHAVGRLILNPYFVNIQASWVKMGLAGVLDCLRSGANDLGGTLMNESISRAAGANHGQSMTVQDFVGLSNELNRALVQRTTLYGLMSPRRASTNSPEPCFAYQTSNLIT